MSPGPGPALQGTDIVCWKKGYETGPQGGPSRLLWNTGEEPNSQPVRVQRTGKRRKQGFEGWIGVHLKEEEAGNILVNVQKKREARASERLKLGFLDTVDREEGQEC